MIALGSAAFAVCADLVLADGRRRTPIPDVTGTVNEGFNEPPATALDLLLVKKSA